MKSSVAVVTRNRPKKIKNFLNCLSKQTIPPTELIIIDSSDNKQTKKIVEKYKKKINFKTFYFKIPHISIPFARNQALEKAGYEIIIFSDDDCRPPRDWVKKNINSHKEYPKAAIIGGRVINYYPKNFWANATSVMLDSYVNSRNKIHEESFLLTSNMSIKKRFIHKKKIYFDENLLGIEDVDFCIRMNDEKGKTLYHPKIVVEHDFRNTFKKFFSQLFFYGKSNYHFYKKHHYSVLQTSLSEFFSFLKAEGIKSKIGVLVARFFWLIGVFYECTLVELKFPHFLKHLNKISINLAKIYKRSKVFGYPWELMIEPTNTCNAHCPLCPNGASLLKRKKGVMNFDLFKKIIDETYLFTENILLWHYGEPFLNKSIFEMISYAKQKKLYVMSSTNGYLFYDLNNIPKILNSRLDQLIISFDGLDKKTFNKYRRGVDFDKLIIGLAQLVKEKKERQAKYLKIKLQFIVMKHNEHQFKKVKNLAQKLGIQFSPKRLNASMVPNIDLKKWLPSNEKLSNYQKNQQGIIEPKKQHQRGNICEIWQSLAINWDGSISPCIYDYQNAIKLGNAKDVSIYKIWNSTKLEEFRKKILERNEEISICNRCLINQRHTEDFI